MTIPVGLKLNMRVTYYDEGVTKTQILGRVRAIEKPSPYEPGSPLTAFWVQWYQVEDSRKFFWPFRPDNNEGFTVHPNSDFRLFVRADVEGPEQFLIHEQENTPILLEDNTELELE